MTMIHCLPIVGVASRSRFPVSWFRFSDGRDGCMHVEPEMVNQPVLGALYGWDFDACEHASQPTFSRDALSRSSSPINSSWRISRAAKSG